MNNIGEEKTNSTVPEMKHWCFNSMKKRITSIPSSIAVLHKRLSSCRNSYSTTIHHEQKEGTDIVNPIF